MTKVSRYVSIGSTKRLAIPRMGVVERADHTGSELGSFRHPNQQPRTWADVRSPANQRSFRHGSAGAMAALLSIGVGRHFAGAGPLPGGTNPVFFFLRGIRSLCSNNCWELEFRLRCIRIASIAGHCPRGRSDVCRVENQAAVGSPSRLRPIEVAVKLSRLCGSPRRLGMHPTG